jgi:thiol:disulfide interchange protein/DsbC/DsbD-like thiol-disulfide interchange protein
MRASLFAGACISTLLFAASALGPGAKAQAEPDHPIVKASLLAGGSAVPGQTLTVALRQQIPPGWHTYWVNPGDAGEAAAIEWKLPQGYRAGPILWPLPTAVAIGPFTNYAYENEAILLADIAVPKDASGQAVLSATARWQVCKEICVPEESKLSLTVPVAEAGAAPASSPDAALISRARQSLPGPLPEGAAFSVEGARIFLKIPGLAGSAGQIRSARFFPRHDGDINNSAPQEFSVAGGDLYLVMSSGETSPGAIRSLDGDLALEGRLSGGQERRGYAVTASPGAGAAPPAESPGLQQGQSTKSPDAATPQNGGQSVGLGFVAALASAFLGGLILNLMPCVFPVLALKAVSFATPGGHGSHSHAAHGGAYLAGVMISFAALAAALIGLRAAGTGFGWGFQFQSPHFVLGMAALFFILGLSLSGVFSLGASFAGVGDDLARRQGAAGFFFTGVLATIAATPCTAPFMGAAVAYALAQPPAQSFTVLMALGLGFGAPMTLLSAVPFLRRLMPRPGPWMETLKELFAFLLYASAAWMVWVLSIQQGSDGVLAAGAALTGTAFAAWLLGRSQRNGDGLAMRLAAPAAAAAVLFFSLSLIHAGSQKALARPSDPEPFTYARLNAALAKGSPVFVNVTAAWCITCKVNEHMALSSERVADAMKERGVVYLKGDWTNGDPEITKLLDSFGRKGVPLYLFFPGGPRNASPVILPQFLTESIVMGQLAGVRQDGLTEVKAER